MEISNVATDFNLIYHDTDASATPPPNPSAAREAIYVTYAGNTATTTDVATATASGLNLGVMGVPRAADLGFTFPDNTQFFMFL